MRFNICFIYHVETVLITEFIPAGASRVVTGANRVMAGVSRVVAVRNCPDAVVSTDFRGALSVVASLIMALVNVISMKIFCHVCVFY